jgi:TrmH family RNA methyltransferase
VPARPAPALGAAHRDVKHLRRWLRDRAARASDGVFVVEGVRATGALIGRGLVPRAVYVESVALSPVATPRVVAPGVLARVAATRTTPGAIAVFDRPAPAALRAAVNAAAALVVLTRVNDPGNLGTIARSAQAAGFDGIVVGPGSVDPYNPKAVRAGAGAIGSLPVWAADEEGHVQEVLRGVVDRGGRRVGADAAGPIALDDAPLTAEPLAIVLGHETAGLAPLELDAIVSIPMAPGSESLNVAMAATVLCFEAARRRREAGGT